MLLYIACIDFGGVLVMLSERLIETVQQVRELMHCSLIQVLI